MIWQYKNSNLTISYTHSEDGILLEDRKPTKKPEFWDNILGEAVTKQEIFDLWREECFAALEELPPLPEPEILIDRVEVKIPTNTPHNIIHTKTTAPRNNPHPMPDPPKSQILHIPHDAILAFKPSNVKTLSETNVKYLSTPKSYAKKHKLNLRQVYRLIENVKILTTDIDGIVFINQP